MKRERFSEEALCEKQKDVEGRHSGQLSRPRSRMYEPHLEEWGKNITFASYLDFESLSLFQRTYRLLSYVEHWNVFLIEMDSRSESYVLPALFTRLFTPIFCRGGYSCNQRPFRTFFWCHNLVVQRLKIGEVLIFVIRQQS